MTDLLTGLLVESRQLGFLGPGPVESHHHHALAFASAVDEPPARALDLGAGGGLPGLVLAAAIWPETTWTFLDAHLRRTAFLREAVETLGLEDRVEVVTARAEETGREIAHRERYDLVVARSFGAPAVTAECAAPLLRTGGLLVVSEPPTTGPDGVGVASLASRWPTAGVAKVGFGPADLVVAGDDQAPVHLARLRRERPVAERYPRRVGIPGKRPLF